VLFNELKQPNIIPTTEAVRILISTQYNKPHIPDIELVFDRVCHGKLLNLQLNSQFTSIIYSFLTNRIGGELKTPSFQFQPNLPKDQPLNNTTWPLCTRISLQQLVHSTISTSLFMRLRLPEIHFLLELGPRTLSLIFLKSTLLIPRKFRTVRQLSFVLYIYFLKIFILITSGNLDRFSLTFLFFL
jgi:hypothetical protein